jgi:hypothetical protein
MEITAGTAELACRNVRTLIQKEDRGNPAARFATALECGDVGEIQNILNGAWFGVPESTSCWGIPGFSEAADLLEDPPKE